MTMLDYVCPSQNFYNITIVILTDQYYNGNIYTYTYFLVTMVQYTTSVVFGLLINIGIYIFLLQMTFCFVSTFYELLDGVKRRNILKYIEHISYIYNIGVDIIFFTDIEDRLSKIYPTMKYVNMPRNNIPLWNKINSSTAERIPYGFDTTTKEYSALTISKPYFLNEAKVLYPGYDHYVWIDSGIASHGTVPYEEFLEGVKLGLTDKIRVVQMKYPTPQEREGDYLLRINKGIISASIISVPCNLTEFLWDKTLDAVEHMLSIESLCLDEHVLAYINGKNMDKFDYWFSDYTVPINLRYIRMEHSTVIRNLDICTTYDKHIACQIARILLDSIEFVSEFPKDLISTVLYKIHLMSFYVPEEKHKGIPIHILTGRIMHYIIKNYSLVFPSNVRENLLFSGIDINDEPTVSMEVLCYTKQL